MESICEEANCARGMSGKNEKIFSQRLNARSRRAQPVTAREQELSRKLEECNRKLEGCVEALAQSRRENELLRQKIDLLVRRVFGSSSERLDRAQLELLLQLSDSSKPANEELDASKPGATPVSSRKNGARKERLPEDLPVVEQVIDPEPVKQKPQDWRCIGQEVSEQLDY